MCKAQTLSTGAHSSNNTIKYLKTLLGTFTQFVALFWSHVCHVPYVTCSMSGFMRHMSLVTIMTTSTNLPLLTFPLSTIG